MYMHMGYTAKFAARWCTSLLEEKISYQESASVWKLASKYLYNIFFRVQVNSTTIQGKFSCEKNFNG